MAQSKLIQTCKSKITNKKRIGSGSFGDVYKVSHTDWGEVALKEMKNFEKATDRDKRSLEKEATLLSSLRCKHIVLHYGIIKEPCSFGLVMELMHHGSVKQFLENYDVAWAMKVDMVHSIILGMNYLHTTAEIVHRDLKIENVLVNRRFQTKVSDFGLAIWNRCSTRYRKKSSYELIGTISHIAPESLEDINKKPTYEFDVYSFGITLWEFITMEVPFENAQNEAHMSQCVINGQRPSLDEVPDDCPKFLLKIMKDCWNGIPNERPTFCKLKEIVDKEILEYEKTGEVSKAMEDLHKQAREKTRGSQPEEPEEASSVDQITSGMSGVQVDDDIATDSDPINPSDNGDNHERDHRQLSSIVTSSLQETHESQEEVSSATSPKKSLKKYEPQYPEKIVTDRLLLDVSVKIQGEWKIVAGYLGIPQHEINGIAIDNASYGAQEQACQMLNKWHQRNGGEATHKALAKALNKAERNDIVKML